MSIDTRFEKARIIGARALQISMGAKPKVKVENSIDPIDIAMEELKESEDKKNKVVFPLDIKRSE
jgi:DNA-directed RNA polymerase subunit K